MDSARFQNLSSFDFGCSFIPYISRGFKAAIQQNAIRSRSRCCRGPGLVGRRLCGSGDALTAGCSEKVLTNLNTGKAEPWQSVCAGSARLPPRRATSVSLATATAKTGFTCISAMMVTVSVRVMCGLIHDAIIFVGVP